MFRPTYEQAEEAVYGHDHVGWCRNCGNEQYNCEPDAQHYECEACGEHEVFGAEMFVVCGWIADEE